MSKKSYGILTLSLAGAMLGIGLIFMGYHYAQREAVVVEERIAYGDKSEVSDLTITQFDSLNDELVWTTAIPLSDVSQAESDLQQSVHGIEPPSKNEGHLDVEFSFHMSGSTSGVYDFYEPESYRFGMTNTYPTALYQDVASRVPVGETYTETLPVADYGDYYTPRVYLDLPSDENGDYYTYFDDEEEHILSDYFRKPVGENDMVTISMTHNGRDGINEISTDLESDTSNQYKSVPAVFVDHAIYVATQGAGEKDITLHRLDWEINEEQYNQANFVDIQQVKQLADQQLFCCGESLVYRQQTNQLMVVCGADDVAEKLIVLSLPDLEVVQEIPLDIPGFEQMYQGDDFIVLLDYDQNFTLFEEEGGHYQKAFGGNYTAHLEDDIQWLNGSSLAMDYENGKLIAAFRNYRNYDGVESFLYVTASTIHGCTFAGQYTTSLQKEIPQERYNEWVEQWGRLPVEMTIEQ